jgi:hypothetical protein
MRAGKVVGGDVGRCREMSGDVGRCREMSGNVGEMRGPAWVARRRPARSGVASDVGQLTALGILVLMRWMLRWSGSREVRP